MEFDLENPLPLSHDSNADIISPLFNIETDHMPSKTYHQKLEHSDFHSSIRQATISIIFQMSHPFDPFLSYLAINYLDRFLSFHSLSEGKPWMLRLIAVSCVSLALKMRKTEYSATDIQQDGGMIFDIETIKRMEFLILSGLKWRMRSITAFSFINFFISFFKFKDLPLQQALKARATEIIFRAQNDIKILQFKPSLISASALLCASHELFPLQFPCYKAAILNCSHVHKDDLLSCYNVMQEIAKEGYESVLDIVSSTSTPVNVLDLQLSSSWSSDNEPITKSEDSCGGVLNAMATSSNRQENLKRRKIIDNSSAFSDAHNNVDIDV
ncbi:putative cyclin-D6-1 [Nicotiana tabacum]|uniref:Cyclin-D6-1 n=2 Tax=Nicotiana TaxID=4085 RepID=A0A1S3YB64_TOBAC|nr:PREDICTED: putative cyclin-D6-1 [Nicotiana sylvestris]XP_016449253.1 PREDICTED: putative cyclin-D6-1 [Nicotiana tabacum]